MESGSPEGGAFTQIPLLSACITSRKKEDKNYPDKGKHFHIGFSSTFRKKKILLSPSNKVLTTN